MKSKPKRPSLRTRIKNFALGTAAAGLFIAAAAALVLLAKPGNVQSGQLGASEAHAGEAAAHSLDIGVASQGDYPSAPLETVRDLPAEAGMVKQVVRFSVKIDGLSEFAIVEKPAKPAPPNGFPAIILLHGYVNPEIYDSLTAYNSDMDFYVRKGFLVVKPDLRGQGLSKDAGVAESAYYSMAYNIDIMSLITALKETPGIDKNNLNLWGHSMGAYLALRAAVMSKDIKNTILLSEPGGSLREIYLSYVPPSDENNLPALKTRSDVFSKYGTPAENPGFWAKASPSNYLDRMVSRVQINVGSDDVVVPPQLSADLDAALTRAHKTHEYFVYEGEGHGLGAARPLIYSRSLQYLSAG